MSQINNILTTTFRAVGGNVVSTLNSYSAGMGRLGGAINENSRMSERFNAQWRAIGTTIRYAIAGTAVFGLTRMVGQLRDVNNQLALMSAIGSGPTGQPFSFQQITDLGNQLQNAAVNSITPVNEINDATINFLSTVQNVPKSQIPSIMQDIAKAARLTQTPIEDLTQAATTMNIAFGRSNNAANIGQFSRMWFALIQSAPGGISAAPAIAQAMPSLASMFQLAPGTVDSPAQRQAQMMALTLGVLRTGMPAATAMRGVTYLAQSIAQPTGGAAKALAGIGITPEFVHQQGIFPAIMKLLRTIQPVGRQQARALGSLDLDTMGENANLPGIPASEMTNLRAMIPRIHGIRAAIILASQLQQHGSVRSIEQNVQDMTAAENDHARAAQDLNQAWQRANQRMKLQQATVAVNTMGLQIAQMFEPVLNFIAQGPIGLSHLMQSHRHGAAMAGRVFVGAMAGIGAARFLGVGNLPGIRNIPGVSRLLGGSNSMVPRILATSAALSGNPGILGATPQNPMYVSVINDLFGNSGNAPTGGGGGGGGPSFFGRLGGIFRSPKALMFGASAGFVGAAMATAPWMERHFSNPVLRHLGISTGQLKWSPTGRPYIQSNLNKYDISMQDVHKEIVNQARRVFGDNVAAVSNYGVGMWHGQTDVNLTITREHADGSKTRQRVHVPVDMWAGGRHPGHRGQPKSVRTR